MTTTPWTSGKSTRSPFAMPRGRTGRLAGRLMLWTNRQREVLDLLDVRAGQRVLEVGYGPGGLVRLLSRTPAAQICGVDPSPEMRELALRPHRDEIAVGRVDLRLGTAEETGFDDAMFDRVVSVNNVAFWSDLHAGLRELHRVTAPGGRTVIAWHGGGHPGRIDRRLALPESALAEIERGLADLYSDVTRHELTTLTALSAA